MKTLGALLGFLLFTGASPSALASDQIFAYLYSAEALHPGHFEYEQWNTFRTGRAQGDFRAFDLRNAIGYGVTHRLTTALFVNSNYINTTSVPSAEDPAVLLPDQSTFDINGASIEIRYQLMDPEHQVIGLSLMAEPELNTKNASTGGDAVSKGAEFRLILQKNLLNDQLILVSNLVLAPEWEKAEGKITKSLPAEFLLGGNYQCLQNWSFGAEFRNLRRFGQMSFGNQLNSVYYLGPSAHFVSRSFWASLAVLPQLTGNLNDYEKLSVRARIGISF